jgi:hypothetical protein
LAEPVILTIDLGGSCGCWRLLDDFGGGLELVGVGLGVAAIGAGVFGGSGFEVAGSDVRGVGVVRGFAGSGFGAIDRADSDSLARADGVDLGLGCGEIGKEKDLVGGDADRSSRVAAPKSAGKGGLA